MKLQVQGKRVAGDLPDVKVRDRVQVRTARATAEPILLDIGPEDVVEIEMADGVRLWLRPEDIGARLPRDVLRSRAADGEDVLLLPTVLTRPHVPGGITRGAAHVAVEQIAVLAAAASVTEAARKFEGDTQGLFRLSVDGTRTPVTSPEALPENGPWLLFIHGTASTTDGSFGALMRPPSKVWQEIHALYPGRVLAFDHRSLTQDPAQNVAELLEGLPKGIELHLVTHSRGGLVGELLAWPQVRPPKGDTIFSKENLATFPKEAQARMAALGKALVANAPRVTRFVRVACPAGGTSLVDGRIGDWINLIFNVLSLLPVSTETRARLDMLRGIGIAAFSPDSLNALPGVAAMAPEHSPLLCLLNQRILGTGNDGLMVISGDTAASGLLSALPLWFLDAYFGADHDLVVDTTSMGAGMTRAEEPPVFFDQGPSVNHFSYFANTRTVSALLAGLRGQGRLVANGLTERAAAAQADPVDRGLAAPALARDKGRPLAVVLPGILGSSLKVNDRVVWVSPFELCRKGIAALAWGSKVSADGVMRDYYGDLIGYLRRTHEVLPMSYDWRQPIQDLGPRVAQKILESLAGDSRRPLHLVGHSMGGLVARMALIRSPDLKREFRNRSGSRLLMLGTPNGGSHAMAMAMLGRDFATRALAFLGGSGSLDDITAVIRGWPGATQLLPPDMLSPAVWRALAGRPPPAPHALKSANAFWRLLGDDVLPDGRTLYISGQGRRETVNGFRLVKDEIQATGTMAGDGTVLWSTGIPKDVPAWNAPAQHGDLCRRRSFFPAIAELLFNGDTRGLPRQPAMRDGPVGDDTRILPERELPILPSQRQFLAMAMGGVPGEEEETEAPVRVRVVHGDLKRRRRPNHPVLVGHFVGDPISGSEAALDTMLGGRLTQRNARGLHPGLIGTWDVALDNASRHEGIVAGLGVLSTLSAGALTRTIRSALLAYVDAAQRMGRERPLTCSTVLLGSGGGVVSVGDCVAAILNATEEVNRLIAGEREGPAPAIGEIEIIEAVEQTAITAWHAAKSRIDARPGRFELISRLEQGEGGWRRTGPENTPDSWIEVTVTAPEAEPSGEGPLHYLMVDGRARVEADVVPRVRRLVRQFVAGIPAQTGAVDPDGRGPGRTLFELLWPSRFKEHSLDDRNMRLILDRETAAIPWEMLDDRRPDDDVRLATAPPAVRFGVLRQLVSQRDRPAPPRRGGNRRALVIGDPRGGGSPNAALPGAVAEAQEVATRLEEAKYQVTRLIGEEAAPVDVISALYSRPWDVIHIASHGVAESEVGPGIVLGGGPLSVLPAGPLAQLPAPPELFFFNCCHLGAIRDEDRELRHDRPGMAASLAVEMIEFGCPAVVACGWQVDDTAALRFATAFYDALCEGRNFGTAVREARRAAHDATGYRDSTWGAYQCYGHPGFILHGQPAEAVSRSHDPAAPTEAIALLRQSVTDPEVPLDTLARQIETYGWAERADVASALGDAYAAENRLEEALAAYERAVRATVGILPVGTLQQCLSLPLRVGMADDAAQLRRALRIIEALNLACGPGVARLEIMADLNQRRATLSVDERDEALGAMVEALQHAVELADPQDEETLRLRLLFARAAQQKATPELVAEAARIGLHLPEAPLLALARALIATDPVPLNAVADRIEGPALALAEAVALARACLPAKSPLHAALTQIARALGSTE
ncbi:DUF7379 domain-containing protein [Paenirhodobacter sp.]|uniref:DUF7379 domain-containing protein n=1 Tax=Paenirhodobacter sp. TaxID=1965326 RepID=UPI003B414CBE